MAAALPVIMMAGTVLSAAGAVQQGNAAADAATLEAEQLRRNSVASYAEGTRTANEYRRQGQIMQSNQRAQMAGSGGVTDDAAAVETLGETGRIAKYNALSAMFTAKSKSQGQQNQANARRIEGRNAKSASRIQALGTVVSGATRAYGAGGN